MHDYRLLGAVASDAFATLFLLGIFVAAWWKDRRRFPGYWLIGWSLYTARFIFEVLGLLVPPAPILELSLLATTAASSLFFLAAALVLARSVFSVRRILTAIAAAVAAMVAAFLAEVPPDSLSLASFAVFGVLQIAAGALFIESRTSSRSVGALLAGLSQIVWGLFKLSYPFVSYSMWGGVRGYEFRGFLQVATGASVAIMLYELARDAARRESVRYRALFEGMTDSVFVADFQGGKLGAILEANDTAIDRLGYSKEELQGMSPLDLSRPEGRSASENPLRTLAETGRARFSTYHLAKDGRRIPVEVNASVFLLDGRPVVLGIARDRSEQVASEAKLRAALEQRELLLREMNHRVKNNLQIVSSLLRLQAGETREPEAAIALQDSQARVASMALVHEMLYADRDLEAVDMSHYLPRLLRDIAALRDPSGTVRCETEVEAVTCSIDRAIPLGLIVTELVTNAYKHAFSGTNGGHLRVSYTRSADGTRLVVADDGAGISGASGPGGAHLGMVMVEALVTQIGAVIARRTGPGTTWIVELPADQLNPES
ncbi:MAG: PAS domain S-box protein [Treponema sp.]|nr:PAS domain S-box protein [Treponema sp.]